MVYHKPLWTASKGFSIMPRGSSTISENMITSSRITLNWLPAAQRAQFEVLLFISRAVHGQAPGYLSNLLTIHGPRRTLRSAADMQRLVEPRFNVASYGGRAFMCAGPRLWNALPLSVRGSTSVDMFKSRLKTHLFVGAYQ